MAAEKIDMDYLRKIGDYEGTAKLDHPMLVVAVGMDQSEVILESINVCHTIKITGKFEGCAELEKYERLLRPHGVIVQKFDPIFVTGVRSKPDARVTLYRMIELKSAWLHKDGTLCRDPYCNQEHTVADTETIYRLTDKNDM